jgi:hypothetical protein
LRKLDEERMTKGSSLVLSLSKGSLLPSEALTSNFRYGQFEPQSQEEKHEIIGVPLFPVPLRNNTKTVERAVLVNGKVEHLLEPEYHGDHLRGDGMVLCFCNYGTDIVDRVASVAFKDVRIINTTDPTGWNFNRPVVVALKWEIICRDEN